MSVPINAFISSLRKDGVIATSRKVFSWSQRRLENRAIEYRRREISKDLGKLFNSTVKYGPFAGLRFPTESSWGSTDRGSMFLGLYEKEVLESLRNTPKIYKTFIDLGAADGYYGVGVLINNLLGTSKKGSVSDAVAMEPDVS